MHQINIKICETLSFSYYLFLASCCNGNRNLKEGSSVDKIKKQAIRVAETYAIANNQ